MHVATMLFNAATVLAVLAAVMVFFASLRRVFPGFREWALAQVCGSLGLVMLALRGPIPVLVSVVVGNILVLLHPVLALRGFRRFYGLAPSRLGNADVALVVLGVAALAYFTSAAPNVAVRIAVVGLVGGVLYLNTALAPLVAPQARGNRTQRVLSAGFVVLSLSYFIRGGWYASGQTVPNLTSDPTISGLVLIVVTTQIVLVCGLVYLNFERVDMALAENEQRLRLAQEAARAGAWELDLTSGRTFWSEGLEALYGLSSGVAQPSLAAWLQSVHPDDRPQVQKAVAAAARDGNELEVEWRVAGRTPERWLMTRGRTLRGGAERPALLVGIVLDITDRKRAEDAIRAIEHQKTLEQSEARFRALIEKSTDVVLVLGADRTFRYVCPGSAGPLGWRESELLGRRIGEVLHPEDTPRVAALFERLLAEPDFTASAHCRIRHRDGTWRVFDAVARNHLSEPALEGVVVNARDITEQLQLRERLADAQRLESIGRLAGGVAHDFNNLLTAILGGAECVRDSLEQGEAPQRDDIDAVLEAARRAAELTQQLLAFARRQPVAPAPVALDGLTRDLERLVRRLLPENIALRLEAAPAPWLVRADAAQLRQVLLNLTANARDAMPSGGALTIATANLALDADAAAALSLARPGEHVRLSVSDTGGGLTPEAQAHLFEPFFTTKALGRGTGLGLAAVHGIVKQSQGAIAVESAAGAGTTFHVYLPRCEPEATPESPEPRAARVPPKAQERVLLVEDEPLVRSVAEKALRRAGYEVLVAQDAQEALELSVPSGGLALLITDVVMPGLNGGELASRMRSRHGGLRVLYISGFTQDAIAHHGVLDDGVELLEKPFVAAALLERVRRVLDGA